MDNKNKAIIRQALAQQVELLTTQLWLHKRESAYFYNYASPETDRSKLAFKLLNREKNKARICKNKIKKLKEAIKLVKSL